METGLGVVRGEAMPAVCLQMRGLLTRQAQGLDDTIGICVPCGYCSGILRMCARCAIDSRQEGADDETNCGDGCGRIYWP
jgi:uncharacterized protein with PIN domain